MCRPATVLEEDRRTQFLRLQGLRGPQDAWREGEDAAVARGLRLSGKERGELGVCSNLLSQWFDGVELPLTEVPPVAVLQDYPSVSGGRQGAAAELDRLAGLRKIHWYDKGVKIEER